MKIALAILLVLALAGGGVFAWKEVAPVMAVLKEKDPENFEVSAIIQPGGSIRDEEVIQAANEHKVAMVFTGFRHFKH